MNASNANLAFNPLRFYLKIVSINEGNIAFKKIINPKM